MAVWLSSKISKRAATHRGKAHTALFADRDHLVQYTRGDARGMVMIVIMHGR